MTAADVLVDAEGAGFDGHLVAGRKVALVLVDPAQAYVDPACPLYAGAEDAVSAMRELLATARRNVPVFLTRVLFDPSGVDGGVFRRKVPALRWLEAGRPSADWIDGLEPVAGDVVVTKQYPSAFAGTSLAAALVALGVDTVLIAGLSTSGCIRATAMGALEAGLVPIVVRDAVGDRRPEVHEANLFDIQAKIGEVVSLAEAVAVVERQTA